MHSQTYKLTNSQTQTTLHLTGLDEEDAAFGETVVDIGVVLFLQTGAEEGGEGVVEDSLETTHIGANEFEGGLVALAVDEFDEEFALRESQFLESWRVEFLEFFFCLFHILVLGTLVGQ